MPKRKFAYMCQACGSEFPSGFGLINHTKFACKPKVVRSQEQDDLYEDSEMYTGRQEESDREPDNVASDTHEAVDEAEGHMDTLKQKGTYDDTAVHQYLGLPARIPSAVEKEVCHF